jgi:hypothetical protein
MEGMFPLFPAVGRVVAALALALLAGCAPARFVATVRPQPAPELPPHAGDLGEADALLEASRLGAEASGLLAGLQEVIAILLDGQLAYTVALAEGRATVTRGELAGRAPTLVVPVTMTQLRNLRAALVDGKLDEQELFHFSYVLFVPCLRRIHGMFYFIEPGNKQSFGVDDFMHFALKNPGGLTYHGEKVVVGATVLNVDGFFFHASGLTGDPDVRYEFTIPEALALYRLLVYEADRQRRNPFELLRIGQEVRKRLDGAITYTRTWH